MNLPYLLLQLNAFKCYGCFFHLKDGLLLKITSKVDKSLEVGAFIVSIKKKKILKI